MWKATQHSNPPISFLSCHAPHNHLSFTSDLIFWPHPHDRISEPWRLEKAATQRSLSTSHYLLWTRTTLPNITAPPGAASLFFLFTVFFPHMHGRELPGWPSDRKEILLEISIPISSIRELSPQSNHGIYSYSFWILIVIRISAKFVHDLSLAAWST